MRDNFDVDPAYLSNNPEPTRYEAKELPEVLGFHDAQTLLAAKHVHQAKYHRRFQQQKGQLAQEYPDQV